MLMSVVAQRCFWLHACGMPCCVAGSQAFFLQKTDNAKRGYVKLGFVYIKVGLTKGRFQFLCDVLQIDLYFGIFNSASLRKTYFVRGSPALMGGV
jgi:hypothetical protein